MNVEYSAPAKVILSGEHSVVYGKPALVSAIDLPFLCKGHIIESENKNDLTSFIREIVLRYLKKKQIEHTENFIELTFHSEIPSGRGLGSSAALSVAAAATCLHLLTGEKPNQETINNVAYKIEKRFHENPSGVDVSASCFGGLIFYRKEFEFLKTISALNFKIPKKFEEHLYLIDSGKPVESTKEMVQFVGKQFNKKPKETAQVLAEIEKVTKKMTISIISENIQLFSECITENEMLLEQLSVVSDKTKDLLEKLKAYGRGKITGAGGFTSGSGYILFCSESADLEAFLSHNTISSIKFSQSKTGVTLRTQLRK